MAGHTETPTLSRTSAQDRAMAARSQAKRLTNQNRVAKSLLTIVIALTSGSASTTIDQFVTGQQFWWVFLDLTLVGVAIICVLLAWRRKNRRRRAGEGTLYYLQFLAAGMKPRHTNDVEAKSQSHPDVRAVTAIYPPYDATIPETPGAPGGIDLASKVEAMAHELQSAMNDDTIETDFTLAPDMIWPAAMGVGSLVHLFEGTNIEEIDTPSARFRLTRDPAKDSNGHAGAASLVVSELLENVRGALLISLEASLPIDSWCSQLRPPDVRLGIAGPAGEHGMLVQPSGGILADRTPGVYIDPNLAATRCASVIVESLRRNPDCHVALVARLPKSLALAIGWRLGLKLDMAVSVFDPWERLVTLQLEPVFGPSSKSGQPSEVIDSVPIATRVRHSQPTLDHMVAVAASLRPDVSRITGGWVNLTAHPVRVFDDKGRVVATFPPSGKVARLREARRPIEPVLIGDQDVARESIWYDGTVEDLPDPEPGVTYIASRPFVAAVERPDLVFPAGEIRDAQGRIIGCSKLASFNHRFLD